GICLIACARSDKYTSCPEIRIVFRAQLRQIHPVAIATWEYQNYENYLAICYSPGLASTSSGGIFLLSLMTNYGKFLTLQTATHKTHTKIHNCHVLIDTPRHKGDFFSPVLIVFC
ncbi:TPA: hypothetical protein ACHKK4_005099, partial [Escherichia coli]